MANFDLNHRNRTDAHGTAAGGNPASSTVRVHERTCSASAGINLMRAGVGRAPMNDEIYRPKLLKTKLTLTLAEQLTGVAYHTMYSANEANRLGLIRTLCAENERIEVLLIDLVDYMITQAPENQRWHAVPLPIEKVLPKPGMQPRVNPHDADLIHDIAASLKRGKAVDPIWVFQSQDYYFPVDGHRRLAAHIKAGRDDISAVVIELPEVYARPLSVAANIYRDSLMDYWGGACAVTGIAVPELLRASHAKAWSECDSDADRLNVYNGFLLTAHLDALFDRHLMTFNDDGGAIFAPEIDDALKAKLGLAGPVKLRWISSEHLPFLKWHRSKFQG